MIRDLPEWWEFFPYDWFEFHTNVIEVLGVFIEEKIKVGKYKAGTSTFKQAYYKLQANEDNLVTSQILGMAWQKVHGCINQWNLTIIGSKSIQKFMKASRQITTFMSNFILIIIFIFLTGPRIVYQLLRQQIHIIFGTTGVISQFHGDFFEKY